MNGAVDVLAAVRTPVGRHRGGLASVRVDDLAAVVVREAVARSGVAQDAVDEVVAGCVNTSGEAMGNLARHAALLAGLPAHVPGVTLNRYCASGLSAVAAGAHAIAAGAAEIVVAVGAESMSRSTWPIPKPEQGQPVGPLVARDAMFSGAGGPQHPELEARGAMIEMPRTAQTLVEDHGLSRAELDGWAVRSHQRAAAARDAGWFADETVAVPLPDGERLEADETIRGDATPARLARLSPYDADAPDITPGNASSINDGASALVLAAPRATERHDLRPLGSLIATASTGVDPARMGLGAARALARLPGAPGDLDVIEINEAFAAVVLACVAELGLDRERVNPNGGALALGHALGNSGARLATSLLHELGRRGGGTGAVALCVGGGQGVAALFEVPR